MRPGGVAVDFKNEEARTGVKLDPSSLKISKLIALMWAARSGRHTAVDALLRARSAAAARGQSSSGGNEIFRCQGKFVVCSDRVS